ncbi:MAG: SMC-Scp complex subunit ScpB [Bryocella sp.]
MSLKAKIEAVIYASEEPVTLAQLMGLLGEEGQIELDAEQASLELGQEHVDFSGEEWNTNGLTDDVEAVAEPVAADEIEEQAAPVADEPIAADAPEVSEEVAAEPADAAEAAPDAEDDKKLAKVREKKLRDYFRGLLDELMSEYSNGDRGLEIREVANGFRLATKPEYHDAVRGFVKNLKPPLKLTLQALETLAVIAYKQPTTAPEISEIRGVDSGGVIGSLITRKLVATGGRKQVIGRPILYKTTKEFLLRFGLKDINELPSIEEFEKMAGELNDAVQEEIPMEHETATEESGAEESATVESGAEQSGALDELNAVPEPTQIVHETVEEMISDKSTLPEGSQREHEDASAVEPMAGEHEPQADGNSEEPAGDDE